MTRIIIPQFDVNLVDVTVTRWRKQPGERVEAGESLAELTTDKAVYELEAPASGTLLAVYATDKSVVPTGFIVGLIGNPGEDDPGIAAANEALMIAYRGPAAAPAPVRDRPARVRATPRVRRIAQEKGFDLAQIQAATGAEVIDEAVLDAYLASHS
ncbi:MAG TPA: E3 binding domain-containing protein [Kiritimatiellia bacterium]|nr:E3 binding domain-containing protein [Kiritimatiellia bacterium]HRU69886.1 E3 binding domain-containing protein [Kiritimatiellia bacterium]